MTMRVRAAETGDILAISTLLLEDAKTREALNPPLWAIAPDAAARVMASLETISNPFTGPIRHHWIVAEENGAILAVAHAANVPPPPIIDLAGATAGVLLDDCHFAADADISSALLQSAEQVLADAGAILFVAATPKDWTTRTSFLAAAGYETTTLYMAKTGFLTDRVSGTARLATDADIEGIVRLSARHRAQLQIASPVFWHIHAEADARFAGWMRTSLTLPDRAMFVSGPRDSIDGYIIAQPGSPLHLPPAHDVNRIGMIDDFYAVAFEQPETESSQTGGPAVLLSAAEGAFHGKNIDTALAICPARMTGKADFLLSHGYTVANLWMVKTKRLRS